MDRKLQRGEAINTLIDAAYSGRISRRTFVQGLAFFGIATTAAHDMAEHAAYAQANQAAQNANLKGEYDYIIVGAGAAGCLMAHRLSQGGRASVLVIEGGGTNIEQEKIAGPLQWPTNIGSDTDWGNKTIPLAHLENRVIPVPVGKIIGGGSSINAMMWLRGDKADFDEWEALAGPNWGFNSIAARFKKLERYAGGEGQYRGGSGPIPTQTTALSHPVTRAMIEASKEQGIPEKSNINGSATMLGASQTDHNIENGRRVSAAHSFLLPALSRSNLTLLSGTEVWRLDIVNGKCRGVVANVAGQERRIAAAKEVVLCAGAIHSPKILMLSGVGPADHLRKLGISVVADRQEIGANLQDHVLTRIYFRSKNKMPAFEGTGVAGTTYFKSSTSLPGPDIQILGRQNVFGSPDIKFDEGYAIMPGLMKPKSRGSVRLTGADPTARLLVDPNYLAEQADINTYVRAMEMGLAIGNARAFSDMRLDQFSLRGAGKAEIADFVRKTFVTYFHYAGTCAMGKSASAPVDEALRVRGVEGLRVVDASVMPTLPCSNTHAPVLAIADIAADLILASPRSL
jgi:choline dehydrogenase